MAVVLPGRTPNHEIIWPDDGDYDSLAMTGGVTLTTVVETGFTVGHDGDGRFISIPDGLAGVSIYGDFGLVPAKMVAIRTRQVVPYFHSDVEAIARTNIRAGGNIVDTTMTGVGTSATWENYISAADTITSESFASDHLEHRMKATLGGSLEWSLSGVRQGPGGDEYGLTPYESPVMFGYLPHYFEIYRSNPANVSPRVYAFDVWYDPPGGGQWGLRQRQNVAGTVGGWPLRQRQNGAATGSWPLRQRQAGN